MWHSISGYLIGIAIPTSVFIVVQSLSSVWLFDTPWTAARQVSLSFTISLKVKVTQSCLTLCDHMTLCDHIPWNSPGQNTGVGSLSLTPGDLPWILPSIFPSIKVFSNESVLCTVGEGKYQDDVINFCQRNFVGWWKSRTVYFYILLEKLNIGII